MSKSVFEKLYNQNVGNVKQGVLEQSIESALKVREACTFQPETK